MFCTCISGYGTTYKINEFDWISLYHIPDADSQTRAVADVYIFCWRKSSLCFLAENWQKCCKFPVTTKLISILNIRELKFYVKDYSVFDGALTLVKRTTIWAVFSFFDRWYSHIELIQFLTELHFQVLLFFPDRILSLLLANAKNVLEGKHGKVSWYPSLIPELYIAGITATFTNLTSTILARKNKSLVLYY